MQLEGREERGKKRTRRSKKCNRGLAATKHPEVGQKARKEDGRRNRRETRIISKKANLKPRIRPTAPTNQTPKSESSLRERLNFCVLHPGDVKVPTCPHGPCLLFGRRSKDGEMEERFFGCAVYRSNRCNFRVLLKSDAHDSASSSQQRSNKRPQPPEFNYGKIRKSVNRLTAAGDALYYCEECNDAVSIPHRCPVVGPVKRSLFRKPTRLLNALNDDDGEAQYWFNDESLRVISDALMKNGCDGVLCIGAPTLAEYFRSNAQRRESMKCFLLDVDSRFTPFYLSSQFAQFSMLTNHLYDPSSIDKLNAFLASVRHLAIVCDPPFGVIMESLFRTIDTIRGKFKALHGKEKCAVNLVLVMPLFVAKHVKQSDGAMEMLDYKVCYVNHPKYAKPDKSIVRLFTDFPLNNFVLPAESGYRFCDMCERYVANENRHCGLCGICPSKDGSRYRHCELCNRCVKGSYRHCKRCERCHLEGRCPLGKASVQEEHIGEDPEQESDSEQNE